MEDSDLGKVRIHTLKSRPDLLEGTAKLINEEWPRSMTARVCSLTSWEDGPLPCSLVMTVALDSRVIGHTRLIAVVGKPKSALIETVVVTPEYRGQGLGRRMMEEAEYYASSIGIHCLHLSTHDKEEFYSHLGYQKGHMVSPQRRCLTKLKNHQDNCNVSEEMISEEVMQPPEESISSPPYPLSYSHPPCPSLLPPPPPPPPQIREITIQSDNVIKWMVKHIS